MFWNARHLPLQIINRNFDHTINNTPENQHAEQNFSPNDQKDNIQFDFSPQDQNERGTPMRQVNVFCQGPQTTQEFLVIPSQIKDQENKNNKETLNSENIFDAQINCNDFDYKMPNVDNIPDDQQVDQQRMLSQSLKDKKYNFNSEKVSVLLKEQTSTRFITDVVVQKQNKNKKKKDFALSLQVVQKQKIEENKKNDVQKQIKVMNNIKNQLNEVDDSQSEDSIKVLSSINAKKKKVQ